MLKKEIESMRIQNHTRTQHHDYEEHDLTTNPTAHTSMQSTKKCL